MVAKSRGVSAASADSFLLRHGTQLFSLRIKTDSRLGQGSWPVKFGSRILFTQRARAVPDDQRPDERIAKATGKKRRAFGFVQCRSGKGHTGGFAWLRGKLQAEPGRWDFLTGPKSAIYKLSHDGFKLAVSDGSDAQGLPVHSTRMVLVDRHGQIRGYYDATEPDAITNLVADTTHLLREQPK
jgi:hypothetical protein